MDTMRDAIGLLTRLPVAVAGTDRPGAAAFAVVGALVGAVGAVPLAVLAGPAGEPVLGAIAAIATVAHRRPVRSTSTVWQTPPTRCSPVTRRRPSGREQTRISGPAEPSRWCSRSAPRSPRWRASPEPLGSCSAHRRFVVVTALSRVVPVVAVQTALVRSASPGLGSWFGATVSRTDAIIAAGTAALVLAAAMAISGAGWTLLVAAVVELGVGLATVAALVRLRGSLDGDGMGAVDRDLDGRRPGRRRRRIVKV